MIKYDLINQQFNKWTVIRLAPEKKKTGDIIWECQCECGNIGFVKTNDLRNGYSKQCVKCGHKPIPYKEEISECVWNKIKRKAFIRKIKFVITKEEAYKIYLKQNKKCALSKIFIDFPENGTEERHRTFTASLDRIDSSKGYEIDNVQWVNKHVNIMKNIYNQDYFIKFCKLIAENN